MMEEGFFTALKNKRDIILVASDDIDVGGTKEVKVYIFEIESVAGAAGGRAGGYGARRVNCVKGYLVKGRTADAFFETRDSDKIALFEIPYHATAIDIRLPDGSSVVVRGLVDPELVRTYDNLTSN
ncbi:MAG: hypothetical protein QW453_01585 [Thermoprotei archaeon]